MKKQFSLLAILLVICLLCGCGASFLTVSLNDLPQRLRNDLRTEAPLAQIPYIDPAIKTDFSVVQTTFYYDQLSSDAARTVYRAALAHFAENKTDTLYLKGTYSALEVAQALQAVQYDYPQLVCAPWGQQCSYYSSNGKVIGIELYSSVDAADRATYRAALSDAASKILSEAAAYTDPFERELFLYEQIIGGAYYNYSAAKASNVVTDDAVTELSLENRLAHTAYGALVSGGVVCDGYAGAFQLLCNYAGIDAATIVGEAYAGDSGVEANGRDNHAWNLVTLDSGSYYCDPTWDDNGDAWLDVDGQLVDAPEDSSGMFYLGFPVLHRYMNLSYQEMARNHKFSADYNYPADCTGEDNYFRREALLFDTPDALRSFTEALAQKQYYPTHLAFEVRLGFAAPDPGHTLSGCFSGIGGYDYLLSSGPSNDTNCFFVCLYY